MEKRRVWSEESRLMLQGFEQRMFDHDWIDTDVVALLDDDGDYHTEVDVEEIDNDNT
jgi:hypothetical protein